MLCSESKKAKLVPKPLKCCYDISTVCDEKVLTVKVAIVAEMLHSIAFSAVPGWYHNPGLISNHTHIKIIISGKIKSKLIIHRYTLIQTVHAHFIFMPVVDDIEF